MPSELHELISHSTFQTCNIFFFKGGSAKNQITLALPLHHQYCQIALALTLSTGLVDELPEGLCQESAENKQKKYQLLIPSCF